MARITRRSRWGLLGWSIVLLLMNGGVPLRPGDAATTIVVTSLADPGDRTCTPGHCTLREAIAAAQDSDTIRFDPGLFMNGPGTILLTSGELRLHKTLTIEGPGQRHLHIDAGRDSSVFTIAASGVVTLSGVTIQNGFTYRGGGLSNFGALILTQSTVSGNTATYKGGGLSNTGALTLVQSTVQGNTTSHWR
jgi:CSLREA domain-containing protein